MILKIGSEILNIRLEEVMRTHHCTICGNVLYKGTKRLHIVGLNYCPLCGYDLLKKAHLEIGALKQKVERDYGKELVVRRLGKHGQD